MWKSVVNYDHYPHMIVYLLLAGDGILETSPPAGSVASSELGAKSQSGLTRAIFCGSQAGDKSGSPRIEASRSKLQTAKTAKEFQRRAA